MQIRLETGSIIVIAVIILVTSVAVLWWVWVPITGLAITVVSLIGLIIWRGASWYNAHYPSIAPLLPLTAGIALAGVALVRHFAQTNADRQRRITESFAKGVEQLSSDKLEVRLGGVYSLERISKESSDDYWTVMENLTAFVRERTQRTERERKAEPPEKRIELRAYFHWREAGQPDGRADEMWAEAVKQEERGEPLTADIVAF